MAKAESYETSGTSDDCVSYDIASSRTRRSSTSVLGKAVKVEGESSFRRDGSSTCNNILSEPVQDEEENFSGLSSDGLKTNLMGMGFPLALVERVIKEHGGADENVLVEALFNYSKENLEVSYSWDNSENEEENHANQPTSNIRHEIESNNSSNANLDKKSQLLMMDFSEKEIDMALSRLGKDASLPDLVDFIFAAQAAASFGDSNMNDNVDCHSVKTEDIWDEYEDAKPFKKAKPMYINKGIASCSSHVRQQVKQEKQDHFSDTKPDIRHMHVEETQIPRTHNLCSNGNSRLNHKPYFFYGNVVDLPQETWKKMSKYIYETDPEFVNTQFFSALIRKEGYIHNLPPNCRFHIIPKPPMNIEDALPNTRKWWPSWDIRKQINSISSDTLGVNQVCERLSKMMMESKGFISREQQLDFIHQCKCSNLIWVGPNRLKPMEPEQVETILGYPNQHTELHGLQTSDRLALLKYSFQIDTLAYHLSVLKNLYPDGIRVLSVFSGTGGAEIALHRLGIHLKFVLSVEPSEFKRDILKRWWQRSGQTGVLKQIGGIEKLTSQMLHNFMSNGGFDIVIGSNPGVHCKGSVKNSSVDLDFSLYYEFIRVYQRVKSMTAQRS